MSQSSAEGARRVIRDVELSAVQDLLDRPPRASVAFADGGAIALVPARAQCSAATYLFGITGEGVPDLAGREVVMVVDAGPYWFQLRGFSVRGTATRTQPPEGEPQMTWYAIAPTRVLAWDYDSIREE